MKTKQLLQNHRINHNINIEYTPIGHMGSVNKNADKCVIKSHISFVYQAPCTQASR